MKQNKSISNSGFSLVELIIVIAIMAILAAAIVPALIRYIDKSRISDDMNTAATIGKAVELALGEEKAWDDYMDLSWAPTPETVTCNVGGTAETYDVYVIASCTAASNYAFKSVKPTGYMDEIFCNSVNANLGISLLNNAADNEGTLPIKYRRVPDGGSGKADHWVICKRKDNTSAEIWLATDTSNGKPVYRITPNICDEYNR